MATHFSGPVVSNAGFQGDLAGNVTGNVAGNVVGGQTLPAATAYAADGAISPAVQNVSLTKGTAGAYTLDVPGAGNVGKLMLIVSASAAAHVITAASLDGGGLLTFGAAIGNCCLLYARSATAWSIVSLTNVVLS